MIINTEEDLARAQEHIKNSNIEEALKDIVIEDVPAWSWMDRYKNEYQALVTSGAFFEFHPTWTGEWDKDKYAFCYNRGWEKTDTQDPAVCEYSGLRPVEGYKEEEIDKKEETPEEKAYRMGWINGYEEGANDKEIDTKIGDRDFMYKWIREKSGK